MALPCLHLAGLPQNKIAREQRVAASAFYFDIDLCWLLSRGLLLLFRHPQQLPRSPLVPSRLSPPLNAAPLCPPQLAFL